MFRFCMLSSLVTVATKFILLAISFYFLARNGQSAIYSDKIRSPPPNQFFSTSLYMKALRVRAIHKEGVQFYNDTLLGVCQVAR